MVQIIIAVLQLREIQTPNITPCHIFYSDLLWVFQAITLTTLLVIIWEQPPKTFS